MANLNCCSDLVVIFDVVVVIYDYDNYQTGSNRMCSYEIRVRVAGFRFAHFGSILAYGGGRPKVYRFMLPSAPQ